MQDVFQQKKEIRARIEKKRRALSVEVVASLSAEIANRLQRLTEFRTARTVHCYVSWRNEVDTHRIIKELLALRRRVIVPVIDLAKKKLNHVEINSFDELKPGTFGILEPGKDVVREVHPSEIDLILVPGVAFDCIGHRLGFGGGYYDIFLATTQAAKVGLAYQFQLVKKLPVRNEDQQVDLLVTEESVMRFRER